MSEVQFSVTVSELEANAAKIETANESFRQCAKNLQAAGEALCESGGFEGEVRVKFESRMQERQAWLEKMAVLTDEYIAAVRKAAADYQAADEQIASAIKSR